MSNDAKEAPLTTRMCSVSDGKKKTPGTVLGKTYEDWKKAAANQFYLLVVYVDEGDTTSALIDIPVAMQNEGLTRPIWNWLSSNQTSEADTKGPGPKWLDGTRDDEESLAFQVTNVSQVAVDGRQIVLFHVRTTVE